MLTGDRRVFMLLGGVLLVISSVLEFIIGNTFSSVVFGHFGISNLYSE